MQVSLWRGPLIVCSTMCATWEGHRALPPLFFLDEEDGNLEDDSRTSYVLSHLWHAKGQTANRWVFTSRVRPQSARMAQLSGVITSSRCPYSQWPSALSHPRHRAYRLKVSLPAGLCPDPWRAHQCNSLWHTEKSCLSPAALTPSPSSSWRGYRSSTRGTREDFRKRS